MSDSIIKPFCPPLGLRILRKLDFPHKIGIIERLYGKALEKQGTVWTTTANDVLWKLDLGDNLHRWMLYSDYEGSYFGKWARQWLYRGGLVIDSGANIGQALVYVAPFSGVRILAFEPLPEAVAWLKECLELQRGWDVEVINKGIFKTNTILTLRIHGPRSTLRMDWYAGQAFETTTVEVVSLDSFLTNRNEQRVRLWMLNVEGAEMDALEGAEQYLSRQAVDALYLHIGAKNYKAGIAYLEPKGYKIFTFGKNSLLKAPSEMTSTTNILAIADPFLK
ncbi:MAG TPA: FkbM family methyltransferase [Syntrophales bacterium]|nr:FkbM family methyltransferase [Syntrophales bacterium]